MVHWPEASTLAAERGEPGETPGSVALRFMTRVKSGEPHRPARRFPLATEATSEVASNPGTLATSAPPTLDAAVPGAFPADASPVPSTAFEKRFGHPPGLVILFFAEMWERFSYYGMRTLLVLYMVNYLFIEGRPQKVIGYNFVNWFYNNPGIQPLSSHIYGLYTGLVYLTPLLGGLLADRVLGQRKTVVVGSILMAIGHFLMAFENLFFVALLFLIFGNGAFKPNVSSQVGGLYPPGDTRRDRAFSIFYVGINSGAFLQLVCGTLAEHFGAQTVADTPNPNFDPAHPGLGWHYGFGAAGVGMLIGLFVYLAGQKNLAPDNVMKRKAAASIATPFPAPPAAKQELTQTERASIFALCALCVLNIIFWAVYEQQGNTMQLWASNQTYWPTLFGWQIPSTWFQSFNPFMIFVFTPLLNMLWSWQAARGKEPSSVVKMAIGCTVLGLSFIVMVVGAYMVGPGKGSIFWPFACTAMLTIGELYLSPIGLSLVTKVAPARMVSLLMGMWFMSSFFGNYLSGYIGSFYSVIPKTHFFLLLTVLGVTAGIAIAAFNRPLRRAIGKEV